MFFLKNERWEAKVLLYTIHLIKDKPSLPFSIIICNALNKRSANSYNPLFYSICGSFHWSNTIFLHTETNSYIEEFFEIAFY